MKIPLYLAKNEELQEIGLDPVPEAERPGRAVELLEEYVKFGRQLSVILETCTGCGACAKACHSYLGTGDYFNIPAARAGLMRTIYKRNVTLAGKVFGGLTGIPGMDLEALENWVNYFFQCTACRRCAVFCPFGIDTGEIVLTGRSILAKLGIASSFMVNIARNELSAGNNTGMLKPALLDSCSFLEEELHEETGLDIKIPVDKPNSDILYLPSSSEMFTNVDTLMGAAKLFHVLGINWTLSSTLLEAANYGFFFNRDILKEHNYRIWNSVEAVGAKTVMEGECGHGWRVIKMYSEGANGPVPFHLVHVLDFLAARLSELTLIKLPLRATLHDSCNYARSAGLVEAPRKLLRACVEEFVEMTPNREMNYCCGGGSGMLMEEMLEIRMKLGKMKAEQIRQILPIDYVALPCASCKAHVPLVLKHYGMEGIATGGILDLLGRALQL